MSKSSSLVALPPIHVASFSKWDPERKDEIFLYTGAKDQRSVDRDKYRYKLTIVDHPGLSCNGNNPALPRNNNRRDGRNRRTTPNGERPKSAVSFTYTHATFIIPAGRESEYMFSSLSGLRSIIRSANSARLIAVAMGRHYEANSYESVVDPLKMVQDELRYVIQVIASAISLEMLEATLTMKPNAPSLTFYPFLAVHGIGQRNIIDSGDTTCSGRYIIEQCAIASPVAEHPTEEESLPKWVRRLYFLDGNPYVIQSEVALVPKDSGKTTHETADVADRFPDDADQWIIDKSVTAFEYHKSLTAGLFALLTPKPASVPNGTGTLCTGLVIGLGGGSLINFWHYLLGEGGIDDPTFQSSWNVTAVELDETVVRIANQHFGLNVNHRGFSYRIGDGLYVHPEVDPADANASLADSNQVHLSGDVTLENQAMQEGPLKEEERCAKSSCDSSEEVRKIACLGFTAGSFDFIVIDVDSKEAGAGMSCPPAAFVNQTYLQSLHALLHPNGGILAINVAARDISLFDTTCQAVQLVFGKVILSKQYPGRDSSVVNVAELTLDEDDDEPEDLNVVVFAIRTPTSDIVVSIPELSEMTEKVARWIELKSLNATQSVLSENESIKEADAIIQSELCECLEDFIFCESVGSSDAQISNFGPKKKKSGNNKGRNSRRKKR